MERWDRLFKKNIAKDPIQRVHFQPAMTHAKNLQIELA